MSNRNRHRGFIHKKIYMPSHDVQFDLEMAKRNSSSTNHSDQSSVKLEDGDQTIKGQSEDNLLGDYKPTDESLQKLSIPPPLQYHPGLQDELRPSAIFIYNRSIALLKTKQIISHVLQLLGDRKSTFTHLEWVDDFSCVLEFTSNADAIGAFTRFLMKPDEVEGENGLPEAFAYLLAKDSTPEILTAAFEFVGTLRPAKPFSSQLFGSSPKNVLLNPTSVEQLIPFVRFATKFDVKDSSAAGRSLFYALNGRRAGQEDVTAMSAGTISQLKNPLSASNQVLFGRVKNPERSEQAASQSAIPPPESSAKRLNIITSGILNEELDRFMKQAGDVKSHVLAALRDNEKRKTEDNVMGDQEEERERTLKRKISAAEDLNTEYTTINAIPRVEEQAKLFQKPRSRKKRKSSDHNKAGPAQVSPTSAATAPKPSLELFPNQSGTRGGNLRDEVFHPDTVADFEEEEQDSGQVADDQAMDFDANGNLLKKQAGESLSTLAIHNEERTSKEEEVETIRERDGIHKEVTEDKQMVSNDDHGDLSPTTNQKPSPSLLNGKPPLASKSRWGPLFSRLC